MVKKWWMSETRPERPPFQIGGLGEIAIRCRDMGAMCAFYGDVLGLEVLTQRHADLIFYRLVAGVAGHTQVLALFSGDQALAGATSTLHHIALGLTPPDQDRAIDWFERCGQPYRIEHFDWIGWRGVFTADPEGNTVELVAKLKEPHP